MQNMSLTKMNNVFSRVTVTIPPAPSASVSASVSPSPCFLSFLLILSTLPFGSTTTTRTLASLPRYNEQSAPLEATATAESGAMAGGRVRGSHTVG
jgi:hypothetical protein